MLDEMPRTWTPPDGHRLPHPGLPKAERLEVLKELLEEGALSKAEYEAHRAEIEDEL